MSPPAMPPKRPSAGRTYALAGGIVASAFLLARWGSVSGTWGNATVLPPLSNSSFPEGVVVGADQLTPVGARARNVPAELQPLAWAQGALQTQRARPGGGPDYVTVCTVAHIGAGYGITAGHCLDPCRTCAVVEDEDIDNQGISVDWDSGAIKGAGWAIVDRIVWSLWDESTDFAIIHVKGPFPSAAVTLDLDRPVEIGTALTLFSHPSGRPLQWSGYCVAVDGKDYVPSEALNYIAHTCDMAEGSSGAALLRTDSLEAVGIVTGESADLVDTPGRVRPDRMPKGNYAYRLERLPEHVKGLLSQIQR